MRVFRFISLLLLFSFIHAEAAVVYPSYERVDALSMTKNCNNLEKKLEFFELLERFYKSIDDDLPGVAPDKERFIKQESQADNMQRKIDITKDADFHIIKIKGGVNSVINAVKYIKNENKKSSFRTNINHLLILIENIRWLNTSEFEYLYEILNKRGGWGKDGLPIKLTSENLLDESIKYGICLTNSER